MPDMFTDGAGHGHGSRLCGWQRRGGGGGLQVGLRSNERERGTGWGGYKAVKRGGGGRAKGGGGGRVREENDGRERENQEGISGGGGGEGRSGGHGGVEEEIRGD